ncbi:Xyl repressor [Fulvimarina pelagi HTCC2506]|uniref:Xyl repressor n=2 Tax=Fulvimarina pelagi TaxID=217511 RepID=Q0FZW4_9HYPH|nr:ROK family protein [Fulvimarina pelagi]EAU40477.1 Xyl repressor [Fulvimarina pelagi HTCC2506]BAT31503.1 Xyl repressor [Fulvimarina pelagi]
MEKPPAATGGKNAAMLSKTDAESVRAHNRRIVIEHFRINRRSTRRAAAVATGLSLSSASSIASLLIRDGLIGEVREPEDERATRRGRPERQLELVGEAACVAAARLAVGELAVRLSDYAGEVLGEARFEGTVANWSTEDVVRHVADLLNEAAKLAGTGRALPVSRLVFAVQGKVDAGRRSIFWSPALKARNLGVATALEARMGVPVSVHNDCSLMPEGFRWDGDLMRQGVATVFIGFGVGMGLATLGEGFLGERRASTEFGHINHIPNGALCRCGNRGCIEAYASDYAILRAVGGAPPDEIIGRRIEEGLMHKIADQARGGDERAAAAFNAAGLAIGYGLGRVFTLIDPLPIVFTGSGSHALDLLEPAIRCGIRESAIAGEGADVSFTVVPDADALIFEAATNRALSELDRSFANGELPGAEAAE